MIDFGRSGWLGRAIQRLRGDPARSRSLGKAPRSLGHARSHARGSKLGKIGRLFAATSILIIIMIMIIIIMIMIMIMIIIVIMLIIIIMIITIMISIIVTKMIVIMIMIMIMIIIMIMIMNVWMNEGFHQIFK